MSKKQEKSSKSEKSQTTTATEKSRPLGEVLEEMNGRLTFGRALKAQRLSAKLKQEELANMIGLSTPAISRFETGKDFPSGETIKALADALKMDVRLYELLIARDIIERRGIHSVEVVSKKAG